MKMIFIVLVLKLNDINDNNYLSLKIDICTHRLI
jgi:hypothetical protein